MKKLLQSAVIVCALVGSVSAAKYRVQDGKLQFAVAEVNGITCWSDTERDDRAADFGKFSSTAPVAIVDIAPTKNEINIATCAVNVRTCSDFEQLKTRDGLLKNLRELRELRELYLDLGEVQLLRDTRERFNWLRQYYLALP